MSLKHQHRAGGDRRIGLLCCSDHGPTRIGMSMSLIADDPSYAEVRWEGTLVHQN